MILTPPILHPPPAPLPPACTAPSGPVEQARDEAAWDAFNRRYPEWSRAYDDELFRPEEREG